MDFPAPDPTDEDTGATWDKAFAQNSFAPDFLDEFPDLHLTMLRDHLEGLADAKYGAGNWVRKDEVVEEFEPLTRHRSYEDEDEDGNPILDAAGRPVMVEYYDHMRYFRMSVRFRAKLEGE